MKFAGGLHLIVTLYLIFVTTRTFSQFELISSNNYEEMCANSQKQLTTVSLKILSLPKKVPTAPYPAVQKCSVTRSELKTTESKSSPLMSNIYLFSVIKQSCNFIDIEKEPNNFPRKIQGLRCFCPSLSSTSAFCFN